MENQRVEVEGEYSKLIKILDFRLPQTFKKIGLTGAVLIFIILIGYKFLGDNTLMIKDVLRTLILLFMLLASMSKDSFEDEFNKHVRFQSYVLAFVCTAIYAISIPLFAFVFDILITTITGNGLVNFHEVSAFEVLFILMGLQLLFFATLKKIGNA